MEINDNKEIILRLEHILQGEGTTGVPGQTTVLPSASKMSVNSMLGGVSAQILISSFSRILGASGNQQLASTIRQGSELGFLGMRALAGDPSAIVNIVAKFVAFGLEKINQIAEEKKQTAQKYNDLLMLQLRSGQASISANTDISYDRYGKVTLRDRK
jgi:hypothetical protein